MSGFDPALPFAVMVLEAGQWRVEGWCATWEEAVRAAEVRIGVGRDWVVVRAVAFASADAGRGNFPP